MDEIEELSLKYIDKYFKRKHTRRPPNTKL